ncbi:MAG: phosphate ABC transporter permease subunit PstC [candidate division WOR-3 bacterium]|uniref:Phosphate transport system permease protein n=1 Tax=candidate division WOR-3 bacterium TaxID=2052148 RepID=A0A7C1WVS1_UNCW3|nr:phosphate ABC transporter permease subunit PstC [candidate division WOR-3 bacterium]
MKRRRIADRGVRVLFSVNAVLAAAVLLGILIFLLAYGIRAFIPAGAVDPEDPSTQPLTLGGFLFGASWNPDAYGQPEYGIVPLLLGSLITTVLALLIAIPMGIAGAVFIAERLRGGVRVAVKMAVELFAGFPSVVIGFFGLLVLGPALARVFNVPSGLNVLNASVLLALMSLPTIISVSDDALRVVPHSYREAAYALGASPWTTAIRVILPAARSGILAAVMLGFGRAVGETMAVLMVAGNAPIIPRSLFDPVRTITTTIAIELGESAFNSIHFFALFALGFILFLIALFTNLIAEALIRREKRSFTL